MGGRGQPAIEKSACDGRFNVHFAPRDHAGQNRGHRDVQRGTNQKRGDNSNGQVALRILGFLRGG